MGLGEQDRAEKGAKEDGEFRPSPTVESFRLNSSGELWEANSMP